MGKSAKPAAVMGSLVNLKNVATHKSLALTIHVPAEAAQAVLAAFGWPTMVDPVPVAIARLKESASLTKTSPEDEPEEPSPPTRLRHWPEMTLAQQTGVIRNEPDFWVFASVRNADAARDFIREKCGVFSCANIVTGTEAAAKWAALQVRYGNWLRERRGAA
jgi:hypothetical protein